jgi:DNA-binding response OmpR family regulator
MTAVEGAAAPDVAGRTALVVEDDGDLLALIALSLTRVGLVVRAEGSAEAAMVAAEEDPPAIAFVDIGLPGLDGWALIDHLRGDERTVGTRIVVATVRDEDRRLRPPVDAWLTKPFRRWQLVDIVHRLLGGDGPGEDQQLSPR